MTVAITIFRIIISIGFIIGGMYLFEVDNRVQKLEREQTKGQWITVWDECGENENGYKCSVCGAEVDERFPNCPYCCARMKGAGDET